MSIFRELFTRFLTPTALLAFLTIPTIFILPSCNDIFGFASRDRTTTQQPTRQDAKQDTQQDRNSLSGELSLLTDSGYMPAQEGEQETEQYSSLADPQIDGQGDLPYIEEEESFQEDEATLINPRVAARGLDGSLSTANAGQTLLTDNGVSTKGSSGLPVASTSSKYFIDDAPSTNKRLKNSNGLTTKLLTAAYTLTGRPYLDGGITPENGFDDLGFVSYVYSKVGAAYFPKNAKNLLSSGVPVTKDSLRPGDVLVYRNPRNESQYLLGIYTGNGNFLLSSSRQKVVSETAAFGIDYGPYFVGGRRFFEDASAAPLSESMQMAATNGAVKQALASMGDIPKASYKAPAKRKAPKRTSKAKNSKRTSSRSKSSKRK
jgi:cell wall-associated NlpC family hydrolase